MNIPQQYRRMETIHNYYLKKVLGEGSFGKVYLAANKQTNEEVAIKKVIFKEASEKDKQCALNEVRLLASISHQNIISFKTAFFDNQEQVLYIVMEYAGKGDLSHRIQHLKTKNRYMNEQQIWKFLRQVAGSLKVLHQNNIIHRDLKSANIFISNNGDYKIADFNVSKIVKNYGGLAQTKAGTPLYASPQIWGTEGYDTTSDIWSFGVIAYQLCSLQLPYPASSFAQLTRKIIKGKFNRIPFTFSDDLSRVISSMLNKNPSKRPTADQIISYSVFGNIKVPKQLNSVQKVSIIDTIHNPDELLNICFDKSNFEQQNDDKQNKRDCYKQIIKTEENRIFKRSRKSVIQKNNQNVQNPMISLKERVKSFYRAKQPNFRQRVLSIKALNQKRDQLPIKPLVLGVNFQNRKNIPLTQRNQNIVKDNKKYIRLPSLHGYKNIIM